MSNILGRATRCARSKTKRTSNERLYWDGDGISIVKQIDSDTIKEITFTFKYQKDLKIFQPKEPYKGDLIINGVRFEEGSNSSELGNAGFKSEESGIWWEASLGKYDVYAGITDQGELVELTLSLAATSSMPAMVLSEKLRFKWIVLKSMIKTRRT